MTFNIVTNPKEISEDSWLKFVSYHPNGNIFHTPYIYKVYQSTSNYEPIFLAAIDSDENIIGVLISVVQYFMKGFFKFLSSRSVIWSGPIIQKGNHELLNLFLMEYEKIVKKKAIYTEVRSSYDVSKFNKIYQKYGYEYEDHLNILIDLTKSEDRLWKEVYSKRRNLVRRAYKEGTSFGRIRSKIELKECYNILKEVYNRAKLPLPDYSLFSSCWDNSNDISGLHVFIAKNENKIIGTMFCLYYKKILYDWYAGSYRKSYKKYPNDMIPWEVFLWGKKHGYTLFDFGGAGKPEVPYGVRDYKKQFGGEMINFGRFNKVHNYTKMKIAKIGFSLWQKMKSDYN